MGDNKGIIIIPRLSNRCSGLLKMGLWIVGVKRMGGSTRASKCNVVGSQRESLVLELPFANAFFTSGHLVVRPQKLNISELFAIKGIMFSHILVVFD